MNIQSLKEFYKARIIDLKAVPIKKDERTNLRGCRTQIPELHTNYETLGRTIENLWFPAPVNFILLSH